MHHHHRQKGLDQPVMWAECEISLERSMTMYITQHGHNNSRTSNE